MSEEAQLKKRFIELADRAYTNYQYQFTGFLNLMETSLFLQSAREFPHVSYKLFGGMEDCERQMARLGSEEMMGYEEPFPICCIKAEPNQQKFADNLSHRDVLGALMNLGVERSTIGDIILCNNVAYIFCTDKMARFLVSELTQIRHTPVRCQIVEELPASAVLRKTESVRVQVASVRLDALISKVYNLSRGDSLELFRLKRVFVDGKLCENNSYSVKENEVISVRGFGKFRYLSQDGVSKKGKLNVTVEKYV